MQEQLMMSGNQSGLWEDVRKRVPSKTTERIDEILQTLDARKAISNSPFYGSLLQRCGNNKALLKGKKIHEHLSRYGHDRDTFLGNHLVNMYGKCGELQEACSVFEKIRDPNIFSWNILIAVYIQNRHLAKAREVFESLKLKNAVSWNTMIAAYSQNGDLKEAKNIFDQMPEKNVISWNSLVTAFALNREVHQARQLFDRMPLKNVQSWNAMIAAYAQFQDHRSALKLFRELCENPKLRPNDVTFISVLDACCSPEALENGKFVHSEALKTEFKADYRVMNAILNMYGKCRSVEDAKAMFDSIGEDERDVIAWNAMISAYVVAGLGKEALFLFKLMDLEGQEPDAITWVSAFEACTTLNSIPACKVLHSNLTNTGYETNLIIGTSVLEMYSKCGCVERATVAFNQMTRHDLLSWTAIIAGNARNGLGNEALELFWYFGLEGIQPDSVTFLNIITSCSHSGLLHHGRDFFVALNGDYNIPATLDHYLCFIDLLGRIGQLEFAEQLINKMPFQPDSVAWVTLLGACKTHGDSERGERISKLASAVKPDISSPYVYRSTAP